MNSIRLAALVGSLAILATAACAKGEQRGAETAAAGGDTAAPMAAGGDTGMAGMDHSKMPMADSARGSMQGMSMTGDPDRDFLRMMSDHHKGLIAMAHDAVEGNKAGAVKSDATTLDRKQDAELEKIQGMLAQRFQDQYEPKVMPDNQRMVDDLKTKSGKEYDKAFLQHVVMHHQQAIKMIDDYLPKGKLAEVKAMAEKMKSDQQREIQEFQRKIASM